MKKNKRERLTLRNKLIHARFKVLSDKKSKAGKTIYNFSYIIELLEEEFPPLSAAYIQQILSHEPHEFPAPKSKRHAKRKRK